MAKIPFSKFQSTINVTCDRYDVTDKNGNVICYEVRSYLPYKDRLEMVSKVVNQSMDDNGFFNPMKVKLYLTLELVFAYTNITFTDKQKEDGFKLYDLLITNGIVKNVIATIGDEYHSICEDISTIIGNIYNYKNSVAGILSSVANDYSSTTIDLEKLQSQLKDPESFEMLRQIFALNNQTHDDMA